MIKQKREKQIVKLQRKKKMIKLYRKMQMIKMYRERQIKIVIKMVCYFKVFYKLSFKIDLIFLYRDLGFMIEFFRYIQNLDIIIRYIFMKMF